MRVLRHKLTILAVVTAALALALAGFRPASAGVIDEFSPVTPILAASETLALTQQQRTALTDIDLDFRAAAVRLLNERELLRIEAQRARGAREAMPTMTAEQLRAIEAKTLELKVAWLNALTQARAVLSLEQQGKLSGRGGSPPAFGADAAAGDPADLDARIGDAVARRLKDAKVVEVETTQAIAERLVGWAKSFGLVVGVPLGLVALVLGGLGIKSYSDFTALVGNARKELTEGIESAVNAATKDLESARKNAAEIVSQAEKLRGDFSKQQAQLQDEYSKLHTQFSEVTAEISQKVQELSVDVKRIDKKINLVEYQKYFETLGYKAPPDSVVIEKDTQDSMNAYYDGEKIVVDERMADMPDVIYREYTHRALAAAHDWSNMGDGLMAIESGLSDYFPCSYQDNPRFGQEYVEEFAANLPAEWVKRGALRDMVNTIRFDTVVGAEWHASGEAWSGAFWEIRGLLGRERSDVLLFQTWSEKLAARPARTLWQRFAEALAKKAAATIGQSEAKEIGAIFERRGLTLRGDAGAPRRGGDA